MLTCCDPLIGTVIPPSVLAKGMFRDVTFVNKEFLPKLPNAILNSRAEKVYTPDYLKKLLFILLVTRQARV